MSKKIIIETCESCPHRGHRGGFAEVSYVPYCQKVALNLPYEVGTIGNRDLVTARSTYVIPDWCPLEDDQELKSV